MDECIFALENHPRAIQRTYEDSCIALKARKCKDCGFYKSKKLFKLDNNNFVERIADEE